MRKIGKIRLKFVVVLDSLNFGMNKVSQFSCLRSRLDTFFSEDSKDFDHCLYIDSYSESLAKYIRSPQIFPNHIHQPKFVVGVGSAQNSLSPLDVFFNTPLPVEDNKSYF